MNKIDVQYSDDQFTVLSEMGFSSVQDFLDKTTQAGVDELNQKEKQDFADSISNASDEIKARVAVDLGIDPKDIPEATKADVVDVVTP